MGELENKRRHARAKQRVSCAITCEDRRYSGFVLDVSPQGIFVQTSAKLKPGSIAELELGIGVNEPARMQARVARTKVVPPELRSIARGGLGFFIHIEPPQEFLEFFARVTRTELPGEAKTPAETAAKPKKKP